MNTFISQPTAVDTAPKTFDAQQEIKPELWPSERLLWSGRPRPGIALQVGDVFLIPFGLLWGGLPFFAMLHSIRGGGSPYQLLIGVPWALLGLYISVGRILFAAYRRQFTFYGITSERVIIVTTWFRRYVKSLNIATLSDVSLLENSHRSGTISLGPQPPWSLWQIEGNTSEFGSIHSAFLDRIENARHVYEIILGAQQAAKRR